MRGNGCDLQDRHARVFLITRFSEDHRPIRASIRTALRDYPVRLVVADENSVHETLWGNTKVLMDQCSLGIAVLDKISADSYNPNVLLEIGYMLGRGAKVLILKQAGLSDLPSDVGGLIHETFDPAAPESCGAPIRRWLEGHRMQQRARLRQVFFVSIGGSGRCAMAATVTQDLLARRRLPFRIRIEAVAWGHPSTAGAEPGAREAIRELYHGRDLLRDHRSRQITETDLENADLLLAVDKRAFARIVGTRRTVSLASYFFGGRTSEIQDPVGGPLSEYIGCVRGLQALIEPRIDILERFLDLPFSERPYEHLFQSAVDGNPHWSMQLESST